MAACAIYADETLEAGIGSLPAPEAPGRTDRRIRSHEKPRRQAWCPAGAENAKCLPDQLAGRSAPGGAACRAKAR
jgi:hypothetical protein